MCTCCPSEHLREYQQPSPAKSSQAKLHLCLRLHLFIHLARGSPIGGLLLVVIAAVAVAVAVDFGVDVAALGICVYVVAMAITKSNHINCAPKWASGTS